MRAYVMSGTGQIELLELADPVCGPDEVLMRTEAVSICSTDVSYFRGHLVPDMWPIVPGHEYVGRVIEVGPLVRGAIHPGDRLVYWGQTDFGGMAELRVIRPLLPGQTGESSWHTLRNFVDADCAAAVKVPAEMPSRIATLVEPLTSVLRSLLVNPPRPGDVCVVLGCGPSALLAVQVLHRHLGAGAVIAVDKDPVRLQAALRLGAQRAFNTLDGTGRLAAFISEHRDHFADYVFDALPHVATDAHGNDVRQVGMSLLRPGGSYVIYGATEIPQAITTWLILAKGLRLQATPFDVRAFSMGRSAHVARVALGMIRDGVVEVEPLITRTVSFDDPVAVVDSFTSYGMGGALKTSLVCEPAIVVPTPASAHAALP
jgi:L-gulonate 5-dehydrogenase